MEFHKCDRCKKDIDYDNTKIVSYWSYSNGGNEDELCKKCYKEFLKNQDKFMNISGKSEVSE